MIDNFDGILNREQIRTLISIAEQGSFYAAAARLGVKQPAVNQLVKRLEDKLGRRLFDRSASGAVLTHDGEAVLVYAKTMAQLGVELSRRFRTCEPDTVLRVGIGEEFSRTSLPTVLALFDKLHSNVSLRVTSVIPSETLFKELDEGRLDVVVARQDPNRDSGELICSEPTVWVGWEGSARPIPDPVPLVLPATGVARTAILTALVAAGRGWRIVFEGTDLTSIGAALKAGLGVCACSARVTFPDVVRLDEAGLPELAPSVYVLERASAPRSETHDAFCDVLRAAAHLTYLGVAQA